jgi:hypothetical protein
VAEPYSTLVGAPPNPKTFAFRDWYSRLRSLRISYCAQARATNYYFSQSGNDSTGNGSQGSPYKTIAKANALIAASSGNMGCFFNRGDTWAETAGITNAGIGFVTIGAWGSAGSAKPAISGASANQGTQDGVLVWGDGVWVDGLHVTNWGTTSASNYPVRVATQGTDAALVSNCDADTGNYHIFGHDAGGVSGYSGGISTFVGCTGGILALTTGTVFVAFAYDGGQECIVDSCVATEGYSGGTGNGSEGFYSHTASGYSSLIISNRFHALGGTNAVDNAVAFGAPPSASTPLDARCFEIDTYQEMASSNGMNFAGNGMVRVNGIYNVMPTGGTGKMGATPTGGWWYNGITIFDGTNLSSGSYLGWWDGDASGGNWEHCAVLYQNCAGHVGCEYNTLFYAPSGYSAAVTIQNSIFASTVGQTLAVLGASGATSGNAYFNCPKAGGSTDVSPVQLNDIPQIGLVSTSPTAASQLYQSAQPATDDVVLEYDANWNQRYRTNQNIGPIEEGFRAAGSIAGSLQG